MISADSHIIEPVDLIKKYARSEVIMPKLVSNFDQSEGYLIDGFKDIIFLRYLYGNRKLDTKIDWSDIPKAAWNPDARINYQYDKMLDAEVIYPTLGMVLLKHEDLNYQRSYFDAYNTWLSEFCSTDPKRLIGIAVIPHTTPEEMCKYLEKVQDLKLPGLLLPASTELGNLKYNIFWEAVANLRLPVSFHIHTSYSTCIPNIEPKISSYLSAPREIQNVLFSLIFSGILEKYPNLKIVLSESDIGWVPYVINKMDYMFTTRQEIPYNIQVLPSIIMERQVYHTWLNERIHSNILNNYNKNIMYSNDYPHPDSNNLTKHQVLEKFLIEVDSNHRENILVNNCRELYGF